MSDYALTGKKGTGKSKNAIRIMRDRYFKHGYSVASNLDVYLSPLLGPYSKTTYVRLPDKPTAFDLLAAGHGNPDSYNEEKNGGLFLDEMGTWLNTRTFADKERSAMLDFLAHGRKQGWDAFYIMQDVGQVDKQLREAFIEYVVRHTRYDRVKIPFVGGIVCALFGEKAGYFPRFHVGVTRIGCNPQDLKTDSTFFRGDELHACYDTRQMFRPDYPHGTFSHLSPWHLEGRFLPAPPVPWLLRFWQGLWASKSVPKAAARPMWRPSPGLARVCALVAPLAVDERVRIIARYTRATLLDSRKSGGLGDLPQLAITQASVFEAARMPGPAAGMRSVPLAGRA